MSKRILTLKNKNETILEQMLRLKIDANYSCMIGVCGFCACKKPLSGDFKYTEEPIAYLKEDEFLPCIALPLNDIKLEIEEDKVKHLLK